MRDDIYTYTTEELAEIKNIIINEPQRIAAITIDTSASGSHAYIKYYLVRDDFSIEDLTPYVARYTGLDMKERKGKFVISRGGGNYNKIFDTLEMFYRAIFKSDMDKEISDKLCHNAQKCQRI